MLEMLHPTGADVFRFAATVLRVRSQLNRATKQDPVRAQALSVELFCSPPASARRSPTLARLRADSQRYFRWSATQWQAQAPTLEALLQACERSQIPHDGHTVQCYRWAPQGSPRGRLLLSHGWEGYAFNFALLIELARHAGWEVFAFDHLAHGASSGTLSGLPVMLDTLGAVAAHVQRSAGPIDVLVGHSLGAAAASGQVAYRQLAVRRLVLLASFFDTRKLSGLWAKVHLLSEPIRAGLQAGLEDGTGLRFDDFMPAALTPKLAARQGLKLLVVHDRIDPVTSFRHSSALAQDIPNARMVALDGLGHISPLANAPAMQAVLDFMHG